MADLFPLSTERGTAFGWTGRKQKDIEEENRLRQQANLDYLITGDAEGTARKWGPKIFGSGYEPSGGQTERLGSALQRMEPSSSIVGQDFEDFKGPVLQEPSFNIPEIKSDFGPQAMPSLAESVFTPQMHPDRPERGGYVSPLTFTDTQTKQRAAGVDAGPGYPTASARDQSGFDWRGAPVTRPDVIPELLRAPESTAAESPVVPGGRRESMPGLTFAQLLREHPEEARAYMANRKGLSEVEEATSEAQGRKATQDYVKARKSGATEEQAYAQYGETMEASKVGRDFLTSIGARAKDVAAGKKSAREEKQYQAAQAFIESRVSALRATGDPQDAELADVLEAQAADPKLADQILKLRKQRSDEAEATAKLSEANKPIVIDNVPYTRVRDPQTGEMSLKATPGFTARTKPWWDGKSETELSSLANDPGSPPELRAQAQKTLADMQGRREKTAAAGVFKWSPGEVEEMQNTLMTAENYQRIAAMVRENPAGWGGPGGFFAKLDKQLARVGGSNEERIKARNDIEQSASMLRKAIFGTALSVHEAKFATWLPTGTEESILELTSKLEATAENIKRAIQYKVYLKNGGDPTKLPLMATPQGDVDLATGPRAPRAGPPPTTAEEAAKRLNLTPGRR